MKKFKCLLTAMLLGCSTMSFAQFMNGSGSSASSSSDVEAWKGLRFSYDRVFINQDFDDPDDLDMNGFSVDYEHAFKVAKKLPLFIQTGIESTSHAIATVKANQMNIMAIQSDMNPRILSHN